jgi:UDP-N-acetylglucosamine 2-epimerase (non-hydrolysing)
MTSDRLPPVQIRVMAVYGTRPEAIKLAPLIAALRADPRFHTLVVVTGQHREMLDQVHRAFGIVPDRDLDIHSPGQTLEDISRRVLRGLTPVLHELRPDAVLVQGDTTTSFMGALAAFYAKIPVIHAEAGLRTGDLLSPFPEEGNRRLISQIAALHLAPSALARRNLLSEGIDPATISITGNSVIDALLHVVTRGEPLAAPLARILDENRPMLLATTHRRESWGQPLRRIASALARIADAFPDHDLVLPAHGNPLVRATILPILESRPNVHVVDAMPYTDFCMLLQRCCLVLTDSGGVQEEAPALGKPVLVMRETTERQEAVDAGTARLVGTDEEAIVDAVTLLLRDQSAYDRMAQAVNPYGDGHAARRTVSAIARYFGWADTVDEFVPHVG